MDLVQNVADGEPQSEEKKAAPPISSPKYETMLIQKFENSLEGCTVHPLVANSIFKPTWMLKYLCAPIVLGILLSTACRNSGLPAPGSKTYADLCSAFYLGLAGLQAGEDVRAKEYLTRSTQIAPGEPAGWADLGILQVRQQQLDAAFQNVDKARSLAPGESRIEALLGLIESRRGKPQEAVAHLKRAIALDGQNLKAIYSLSEETERDQAPGSQTAARQLLTQILQKQPSNTAVLLDSLRLAAKAGDSAETQKLLAAIRPLAVSWPDVARRQFDAVERSAGEANLRAAAVNVQFLRNVLLRVPSYREDLDQIKTPATLVAQPFTRFLRLPSPNSEPASPDVKIRFETQPIPGVTANNVTWMGTFAMDDQAPPSVAWADATALHFANGAALPLPGPSAAQLAKNAVAGADLNYDFKTDIAIATAAGLKIYQQQDPLHFEDITEKSKIPSAIATASYTGIWAFDIDLDGDLDLVLGTPRGDPLVHAQQRRRHLQPHSPVSGD